MLFLTEASARAGGAFLCSTFRWCLKNDTSLVVVSIRSTIPNHRVKPGGMLVVHLDRSFAETMFHARPLDPGGELRTDLPGRLRRDPRLRRGKPGGQGTGRPARPSRSTPSGG